MRFTLEPKGKYYIMVHKGIGPIYAEKNGFACLKTEISWRKLSGFYINTKWGCIWIELRRKHMFRW